MCIRGHIKRSAIQVEKRGKFEFSLKKLSRIAKIVIVVERESETCHSGWSEVPSFDMCTGRP